MSKLYVVLTSFLCTYWKKGERSMLNRNMTMLQLFQEFSKATQNINSLLLLSNAMKRKSDLEKVIFVATGDTIVLGQPYSVQSIGKYVIKSEGLGKASYVVKDSSNLTTLYEGQLNDTSESEEMYLTTDDIVYFHASANGDATESITLEQVATFFDIISERFLQNARDYNYLNSRIDFLISNGGIGGGSSAGFDKSTGNLTITGCSYDEETGNLKIG